MRMRDLYNRPPRDPFDRPPKLPIRGDNDDTPVTIDPVTGLLYVSSTITVDTPEIDTSNFCEKDDYYTKAQVDALVYVPVSITSLTVSPSVIPIEESSVVTTYTYTWEIIGKPTSITLNGVAYPVMSNTGTAASTESSGTLVVTDAKNKTHTQTVSAKQQYKCYSTTDTLKTTFTESDLPETAKTVLAGATSYSITATIGASNYLYLVIPTALSTSPTFKVSGFMIDFESVTTTIPGYQVFKAPEPNIGTVTVEVIL